MSDVNRKSRARALSGGSRSQGRSGPGAGGLYSGVREDSNWAVVFLSQSGELGDRDILNRRWDHRLVPQPEFVRERVVLTPEKSVARVFIGRGTVDIVVAAITYEGEADGVKDRFAGDVQASERDPREVQVTFWSESDGGGGRADKKVNVQIDRSEVPGYSQEAASSMGRLIEMNDPEGTARPPVRSPCNPKSPCDQGARQALAGLVCLPSGNQPKTPGVKPVRDGCAHQSRSRVRNVSKIGTSSCSKTAANSFETTRERRPARPCHASEPDRWSPRGRAFECVGP